MSDPSDPKSPSVRQKMSTEEALAFLQAQANMSKLALGAGINRVRTRAELRESVASYISGTARTLGHGVRLVDLNRRFGRAAVRFETSARAICMELAEAGRIDVDVLSTGIFVRCRSLAAAFAQSVDAAPALSRKEQEAADLDADIALLARNRAAAASAPQAAPLAPSEPDAPLSGAQAAEQAPAAPALKPIPRPPTPGRFPSAQSGE